MKKTTKFSLFKRFRVRLDMLGEASSNVHMQYLREGVLMTEAEESKLNQNAAIRVREPKKQIEVESVRFQEESEYPILASKDVWTESRDNLHEQPTPLKIAPTLSTDNDMITRPRHGG